MYFLYIPSSKVTGPTINGTLFLQCKYHNILYYIIIIILRCFMCLYWFCLINATYFFFVRIQSGWYEKKCTI